MKNYSIIKKLFEKILLVAPLLFLAAELDAEQIKRSLAHKANVYFISEPAKILEKGFAHIRIVTVDGMQEAKLHRVRAPFASSRLNKSEILFFHGKLRSRANSRSAINSVAASYSSAGLKVILYSRRARLYTINIKAKNFKPKSNKFINHISIEQVRRNKDLPCGMGENTTKHRLSAIADKKFNIRNNSALNTSRNTSTRKRERKIEIGTDADYEFYQLFDSNTDQVNAYIAVAVNAVNALYAEQLAINVVIKSQHVQTSSSQPYTVNDAEALLSQFRVHTNLQQQISGDLKYLFTKKSLHVNGDGGVVGIAYVGVACQAPNYSYGLTEKTSESIQPIILAHEIGHNLGAGHDFDTPSLMSTSAKVDQDQFSRYSLSQINSYLASNDQCLEPVDDSNPEPKTISFQLNYNPKKKLFGVTTVANDGSAQNCSVRLYSDTNSAKLEGSAIASTENIAIRTGKNSGKRLRIRTLKITKLPRSKIYYRLEYNCPYSVLYSEIKSHSKGSLSSQQTRVSANEFIQQLKSLL